MLSGPPSLELDPTLLDYFPPTRDVRLDEPGQVLGGAQVHFEPERQELGLDLGGIQCGREGAVQFGHDGVRRPGRNEDRLPWLTSKFG